MPLDNLKITDLTPDSRDYKVVLISYYPEPFIVKNILAIATPTRVRFRSKLLFNTLSYMYNKERAILNRQSKN